MLRKGRFGITLPKASSQRAFSLLLEHGEGQAKSLSNAIKAELPRAEDSSKSGSLLLNVGHLGPERAGYGEWLQRRRLRPIFMVHDLIPVTHPEYCRPNDKARHTQRIDTVLRTAAGVVTNSSSTLQALSAYAVDRGLRMPPALAAPLAPATFSKEVRQRPLREPYFLMLSTIEPRKNHWLILHVWRRLVERLGEKAPRLVVIGQRGYDSISI